MSEVTLGCFLSEKAWMVLVLISIITDGRQLVQATAATNWGRSFHTGFLMFDYDMGTKTKLIFFKRDLASATDVDVIVNSDGLSFSETVTLQQDKPAVLEVPHGYLNSVGTRTNWPREGLSLRITSSVDIGARLSLWDAAKGSTVITLLPDSTLGTRYRLALGRSQKAVTEGQFRIIATEDSTDVTFNWGSFSVTNLQIDGNPVSGSASHTVTLDDNHSIHVFCGNRDECSKITLVSTKNIAVIAGFETSKVNKRDSIAGRIMFQNLPFKYVGKTFIGLGTDAVSVGQMAYIVILDSFSQTVTTFDGGRTVTRSNIPHQGAASREGLSSNPTLVYAATRGDRGYKPSSYPLPTIDQYSTRQVMVMDSEFKYHVTIVTTSGDLAGISVRPLSGISIQFSGITLCDDPQFMTRTKTVTKATASSSIIYQTYHNRDDFRITGGAADASGTIRGLVEFRAAELNTPFLLIVNEIDETNKLVATAHPAGLKYIEVAEPCQTTIPVPGDGIDNDCDGRVDEELGNTVDDDGDGKDDEDLAASQDFRIVCQPSDVPKTTRTPTGVCRIAIGAKVTYTCGLFLLGGTLERTCQTGNVFTGSPPVCGVSAVRSEFYHR